MLFTESMWWPLLTMVALVCLVWVRLYQIRLSEMRRSRVHPQALASAADTARLLKDVRASDNFRNLFELPVLFYPAALVAMFFNITDGLALVLAWGFVIGRVVHSLVHCTYNRVMHRFMAYALSTVFLWALWIRLAFLLA